MFRFSLQKALEVRERVEKVRMKEMAEKLARQKGIEYQIESIQDKIAGQDSQANQAKHLGRIDVNQLKMLIAFKAKKKLELNGLNQAFQKAVAETEARRLALVEASRQRKTLAKNEQIQMDEAAGNHYFQHHHKGNHA